MKFLMLLLLVISPTTAGLFDDAAGGGGDAVEKPAYEMNGYVRGAYFGGKVPDESEAETKSQYGEAALKLNVNRAPFGDAHAEMRYKAGNEYGLGFSEIKLREAYVNAYMGPVDVRLGKQIVVWGRADGINPTNNITPQNLTHSGHNTGPPRSVCLSPCLCPAPSARPGWEHE